MTLLPSSLPSRKILRAERRPHFHPAVLHRPSSFILVGKLLKRQVLLLLQWQQRLTSQWSTINPHLHSAEEDRAEMRANQNNKGWPAAAPPKHRTPPDVNGMSVRRAKEKKKKREKKAHKCNYCLVRTLPVSHRRLMSLRIRRLKAGGCCPDVPPLEEWGGGQVNGSTPLLRCASPTPDTHKWRDVSFFIRVSAEWWKAWQQLFRHTRVRAQKQIETWQTQTLKEQMQMWSKQA